MTDDLRELLALGERIHERAHHAKVPTGHPAGFVSFRDSHGRFELSYPPDWDRRGEEPFQAWSPGTGSFVRVDDVTGSSAPWHELEQAFAGVGGRVLVRPQDLGKLGPTQGTLQIGPVWFEWEAHPFEAAGQALLLSLGRMIRPPLSDALDRYETRVLEAIRTEFRAGESTKTSGA